MADTRELILQRLLAIGGAVTGVSASFRNRGIIDNADVNRPAWVVLDGDESVYAAPKSPRNVLTQILMRMRPELYLLLKNNRPKNTDEGPSLNNFRMLLIQAINTDAELKTLLGSNGAISFDGTSTDMKSGSSMAGEMRLNFSFVYVFKPPT